MPNNRVIKFRAWDRKIKRWANNVEYKTTWGITEIPSVVLVMGEKEYDIMQFTGLHDKNGVEIFENDVLAVYDWGRSEKLLGKAVIEWDVDSVGWRYSPTLGIDDVYDMFRNVEVIGNIHQHPNLLEKP